MIILKLKDFMDKCHLQKETMNEEKLQTTYNYPVYPRVSKIYSDNGFVNFDNGPQGGRLRCCFIIKVNNSFYLACLVDSLISFYLNNNLNQ